jgi:NAD(P)-dependent dehydrogenase (short-subunit alcohol dehydrogenase family)
MQKVALVTGSASGIGAATARRLAADGMTVVIHSRSSRAAGTALAAELGGTYQQADLADDAAAAGLVPRVLADHGRLDVLVNNAADQTPQEHLEDISAEQLESTFRTNIFAMFYLTKAALPHLEEGAAIINTTSVTAYKGNPVLLDYSSTKGAIVAFTRSLSQALAQKKILVNGVAPGPIWTPLIPSTFPENKVEKFGDDVPLGRVGQPEEVASCYVFLASNDASYMTGQILHPNGGTVVNG